MRFHVGQRVVAVKGGKIAPTNSTVLVGDTGVIAEIFGSEADYDCRVEWDSGAWSYSAPYALRPIDDDFRAGSWDEICALTRGWRPGVVRCG